MNTIAERIKEGLRLRDMIQADLVEKTGLPKSAISSYINGKYEPKQPAIYLMAKALNVSEAWLMGYDVEMNQDDDIPRTKDALLEYFHKNPQLKVLFSLSEDLSEEDLDYLVKLAKRMKGE